MNVKNTTERKIRMSNFFKCTLLNRTIPVSIPGNQFLFRKNVSMHVSKHTGARSVMKKLMRVCESQNSR